MNTIVIPPEDLHEPLPDLKGDILFPEIKVQLTGTDGNAFAVMGTVKQALRRARVDRRMIDMFLEECMSGDYNHLLATCMKWVNVS